MGPAPALAQGDFQAGNPQLFEAFFWGLILILVLGLRARASYVMLQTVRNPSSAGDQSDTAPVAERRDALWHRRRAEQLAAEGRFVEAMPFDFLALVLELDGRKILRYQPSKTPGEYARTPSCRTWRARCCGTWSGVCMVMSLRSVRAGWKIISPGAR